MPKTASPTELARAALQKTLALREKYVALDRAALAQIIEAEKGGATRTGDTGTGPTQAERLQKLVAEDGLSVPIPPKIGLDGLYALREDYRLILDSLLFKEEIAGRAALHAAHALEHQAAWDADDAEMAHLLLKLKKLCANIQKKSAAAMREVGLPRDRVIDSYAGALFAVEGVLYSALEDLMKRGVITSQQNLAAGNAE